MMDVLGKKISTLVDCTTNWTNLRTTRKASVIYAKTQKKTLLNVTNIRCDILAGRRGKFVNVISVMYVNVSI